MPPRLRKLVATAFLVPALIAYALGAMVLADRVPGHWLVQLLYFIVAGVSWAFPTMALLRWAEGGGARKPQKPAKPAQSDPKSL